MIFPLIVFTRHFSRNLLYCFFFSIIFTIGFILGTLYSPNLNAEVYTRLSSWNNTLHLGVSDLVVVIFSSPDNYERRQTIRQTWLQTKGKLSIKHYFALSAQSLNSKKLNTLKDEYNTHGDLLFLYSFSDNYSRLSEKLREVFRWVDKNMQYSFLLKVDDDSFVRLNALYSTLANLPKERLYLGFFYGQASIKTKGKWKEKNWFLCDRYLPYAKGGGYVLSQDLIRLIVSISEHLSLYQNEDVSLGTWLAPFNINRIHSTSFDTEFRSRGCFNSYIVTHKQSVSMMTEKYKNLVEAGRICLEETRHRASYEYNWSVLPSQCCVRNDQVP